MVGENAETVEHRHEAGVALDKALRSIAPPDVTVGVRRISAADLSSLFMLESVATRRAVPSRQREFATGRALLRQLIGCDIPIPVADSRAPILPEGVKGSLAHDVDFAVAGVTREHTIRSLGIDLEPQGELSHEIAEIVLRKDERGIDAHLAFTLKEAVYKARSGLGGEMLEHHDVRLDIGSSTFHAEVPPDRSHMDGVFASTPHRWVGLVVVRARTG